MQGASRTRRFRTNSMNAFGEGNILTRCEFQENQAFGLMQHHKNNKKDRSERSADEIWARLYRYSISVLRCIQLSGNIPAWCDGVVHRVLVCDVGVWNNMTSSRIDSRSSGPQKGQTSLAGRLGWGSRHSLELNRPFALLPRARKEKVGNSQTLAKGDRDTLKTLVGHTKSLILWCQGAQVCHQSLSLRERWRSPSYLPHCKIKESKPAFQFLGKNLSYMTSGHALNVQFVAAAQGNFFFRAGDWLCKWVQYNPVKSKKTVVSLFWARVHSIKHPFCLLPRNLKNCVHAQSVHHGFCVYCHGSWSCVSSVGKKQQTRLSLNHLEYKVEFRAVAEEWTQHKLHRNQPLLNFSARNYSYHGGGSRQHRHKTGQYYRTATSTMW